MALVDRYSGRQAQHVPLQVAVAVAYFEITGRQIPGTRDADTMRVLNDVAHAVAMLVTARPQAFVSEVVLRPTQKP